MRTFIQFALLCAALIMASCGDNGNNEGNADLTADGVVQGDNHHILIAYFSEPLPDNGVDAATSASRLTVNGSGYGSV